MLFKRRYISDGPDQNASLLIKFCDPLNGSNTVVETSGNTAHVWFISDLSVTASGFQLYWEAREASKFLM